LPDKWHYPWAVATRARDRLLRTAEELFYAQGTRATGVDQILEVSGVGRASFYRHFPSKDDLVVAVLQRRREWFRTGIKPRVAALGGHPLDVFDVLAQRLEETGYRGCAFLNTMVEIPDPANPAHREAVEHKEEVRAYFAELLAAHGYRDDEHEVSRRLLMLYDGGSVTGLRERSPRAAADARAVAEMLLANAPREPAQGANVTD
jgi:AcrR family transcriptional regulator